MPALNLPGLPPKAELWCRTLLLQATKPVSQHIQEPLLLHFSICAARTPLRRVKSEDWNIGSEDFWKDLEDESHCADLCDSDVSDGDELPDVHDDMKSEACSEKGCMPDKRNPTIWKSKRKEKRYWKLRRLRRANALAERMAQRVKLENAVKTLPLWRRGEMPMRVFVVVAVVVKFRRPASEVEIYEPQCGTPKLPVVMCPHTASELHMMQEDHWGPEAPPWSPSDDEDSDEPSDDDLSSHRSLYCTFCRDDVVLPFRAWQCPKCKLMLM